jgi:hypothetical protein
MESVLFNGGGSWNLFSHSKIKQKLCGDGRTSDMNVRIIGSLSPFSSLNQLLLESGTHGNPHFLRPVLYGSNPQQGIISG